MLPLKEATSEKHRIAEKMPFNIRMFKGELSKEDYLLYLIQQLDIYETLESIGLPHPDLSRSERVNEDIGELTDSGHKAGKLLAGTKEYTDYLKTLSYDDALPHIYLNYLAVMFGGQMIKKVVPSSGRMYEFDNMQEALQAVRNVQKDEWADEVNKGFDFNIRIFDDLQKESTAIS